MGICKGIYTRDVYFIPTILYHKWDDFPIITIELAFLKWYIGICW